MKTGLFADLSEEDKEIAEYGLKQGLILIGGLILAVAVGWLLGIPGQAVLFLLLAYILRIFAGGYHATTPARCGVISAIFILICFLCIKYITLPSMLTHGLTLAGGLFIMRFAPGLRRWTRLTKNWIKRKNRYMAGWLGGSCWLNSVSI